MNLCYLPIISLNTSDMPCHGTFFSLIPLCLITSLPEALYFILFFCVFILPCTYPINTTACSLLIPPTKYSYMMKFNFFSEKNDPLIRRSWHLTCIMKCNINTLSYCLFCELLKKAIPIFPGWFIYQSTAGTSMKDTNTHVSSIHFSCPS